MREFFEILQRPINLPIVALLDRMIGMAGKQVTDDEWLQSQHIEATDDELDQFIEDVDNCYVEQRVTLPTARQNALSQLIRNRSKG